MPEQIVVLLTLKDSADPEEFENFVREHDYPIAKSQPGVIDYVLTRIGRPLTGAQAPAAEYLEVLVVEDADRYEAEMSDEFKQHLAVWAEYVDEYRGAVGTVI